MGGKPVVTVTGLQVQIEIGGGLGNPGEGNVIS